MKNLKTLFTALLTLVAGAFVSCTQEFQPGEVPSGPQVCFNSETEDVALIAIDGEGDKTFDIELNRVVTEGELEVAVLSDCGDNAACFVIPESVVFADGENSAKLTVVVNIDLMDDTKEYPVEFLIPDSKVTTPYGLDKLTVKFKLNPWVLLNDTKKAKVRVGDALTGFWKDYIDPNMEIEVKAYEHKLQEGVYMFENPWEEIITSCFESLSSVAAAAAEFANVEFTGSNLVINCADPKKVFIEEQLVANHKENGEMKLVSKYPTDDATAAGEMFEGVITFPKNALVFNVKTKNGVAWNGNANSLFRVVMPGSQVTDYSLAFAYEGMEIGVGSTEATAKFKFTYGDDVTGIKYLIAAGNVERNSEAAVEALFAGTDPNIVDVQGFSKGGKEMVVKTTLPEGLYTMIAAPKNVAGNLNEKSLIVKSFYFSGLGVLPDHSCNLNAWVKSVSEHNAELSAEYPDHANYVCHIQGEELKDVWMVISQNRFLPKEDAALIDYVKANGTSLVDDIVTLNSAEGWTEIMSAWENIEYTVAIYAVNDYDQGKLVKLVHKTADIEPYTGELKLGKYSLTCEKQNSYNTFTLKHRAGSTTEFFVEDFCYEDGNQWYATYDATAGTLTLSGVRRGAEGASSFTKQLGLVEVEGLTYGYAFYSIDNNEDAEDQVQGTDPFVFTVDAETKALTGADSKFLRMHLLDLQTGGISTVRRLLNYFNFTQSVVIAPVVENDDDEATVSKASVVPFSSMSVQNSTRNHFVKNISGAMPFRSVKAEVVAR